MDDKMLEFFSQLPKQGPGDSISTIKAYRLLKDIPEYATILDAGCGSGSQTIELSKLNKGKIIALDYYEIILNKLKDKIIEMNLGDRVECIQGDMGNLNYDPEKFDLIWCEGAAFTIGFFNALEKFNYLIKKGGYIVVSELVFWEEKLPVELENYMNLIYPQGLYYLKLKEEIIKKGYNLVEDFKLPKESWWDNYYKPAELLLKEMKKKYKEYPDSIKAFDEFTFEIEMFKKYSNYYGYSFFIIKK